MRQQEKHTEKILLEGFRNGRQQCFAEVFNLLFASLCHFAFKITNNQAASEDIVEDSFIKIWERREIFFEINVLKSYIYTTVRNASINWIKKQNKVFSISESLEEIAITGEADTFKNIALGEVYNKLALAIEQLSPQGKQIIKMIFFEGKKTKQVAQELGVSQSTVKTQKGRSILKMKQLFDDGNVRSDYL